MDLLESARRLEANVESLQERINALEGRIHERCDRAVPSSGTPTAPAAGSVASSDRRHDAGCEDARELVQRLETLKDRLQRIHQWLDEHFPNASAPTATGATTTPSAP